MDHSTARQKNQVRPAKTGEGFDINALLRPACAFALPADVVRDPDLTLNEKRAILASWASDACALESAPELRKPSEGRPVRIDDIMDALTQLDAAVAKNADYGKLINRVRRLRGPLSARRERRRDIRLR